MTSRPNLAGVAARQKKVEKHWLRPLNFASLTSNLGYVPPVVIVTHEVNEVQGLGHGRNVVSLIDGLEPCRNGGRQEEVVLVKGCSHFAQKLGVVLFVFGKAWTILSTT